MANLTENDIQAIIHNHIRELIEGTEEDFEFLLPDPDAPEGRMLFKDLFTEEVESCARGLRRHDYSRAEYIAQKIMEENGIQLAKDSLEYKKFLREVLKTHQIFNEIMARRAESDYISENKILPSIQVPPLPIIKEQKPSLPLGEVIQRYVTFQMSEKKWNLKSRRTIEPTLLLFQEFVGNLPVSEIEPDHGVVKFKQRFDKTAVDKTFDRVKRNIMWKLHDTQLNETALYVKEKHGFPGFTPKKSGDDQVQ